MKTIQSQYERCAKPGFPFGVLPTLEIDGKVYHQSLSLSRYLGKKHGLAGSNDLESLEVDQIVDTIVDFRLKLFPLFYENDKEKKKALFEELSKTVIPYFLDKFEAIAAANNGHLALGKLTWADFILATTTSMLRELMQIDICEINPKVKIVVDNVFDLPAIQKYYENAPNN